MSNKRLAPRKEQKSDLELVAEFRSGDVQAFNELVRRYQQRVYWIARRMIGSHEDADDITQDVFVKVYDGLQRFRSDAGFFTWLYRITVNVTLNAVRKKRVKNFVKFEEVEDVVPAADEHADGAVLKSEFDEILNRAIERLPAKQKMVFMMRYYDELPYEEMAAILHKSVGGLKANYFFALKKIQEYVRREVNR